MTKSDLQHRIRNRESFLLANDGQFLGTLTLNHYNSESITNQYGPYGNPYSSTSIINEYCTYGSPYSSLSPYNPYTSTPPTIYLHGQPYGYLTKNEYLGKNIVDPDNLIPWIREKGLMY